MTKCTSTSVLPLPLQLHQVPLSDLSAQGDLCSTAFYLATHAALNNGETGWGDGTCISPNPTPGNPDNCSPWALYSSFTFACGQVTTTTTTTTLYSKNSSACDVTDMITIYTLEHLVQIHSYYVRRLLGPQLGFQIAPYFPLFTEVARHLVHAENCLPGHSGFLVACIETLLSSSFYGGSSQLSTVQ